MSKKVFKGIKQVTDGSFTGETGYLYLAESASNGGYIQLDGKKYGKTTIATNITWSALKSLRDGGNLIPGQSYRITDYVTTTSQNDTQSAGHQFDIIVVADSVNKLNEKARAIEHSGDTYFSACTLSAWQIWYCLDNDTNRFMWADTSSGKGVIYRMIDEWNNDCPYDFKNIQFPRYKITSCPKSPDLEGSYSINGVDDITVDTSTTYWCYTFSMIDLFEDVIDDVSVFQNKYTADEGFCYKTQNNVFKSPYDINYDVDPAIQQLLLPNNVFVTDTDITSIEEDYSYGEFYGFYSNTIGNYCNNNTFGNYCQYITFGNYCQYNTFGNDCDGNTFGNYCRHNTFGKFCNDNTFGNWCEYNTFGNNCNRNTFGNICVSITFGNHCQYNTFGNYCKYLRFQKDYVYYCIVENGNQFIDLTSTQTTSNNLPLRNVTIAQGVNNTGIRKTISHNTVNDTFRTVYGDIIPQVTYTQLVSLRNSSGLTPGQSYRITDYNTYVSDLIDYAQSANHQFDIIVKADSTNKLNENARAIQHSGDTYFSGSTLSAWELKYCLDNDSNRFNFVLLPHDAGIVVPDFTSDVLIETNTTIETNNGTYYVFGTQEQAQEYWGDNSNVYFCCASNSPEVDDVCYIAFYDEDKEMYINDEGFAITKVVSSSSSNGKGVIYWMKDEWDNECPYDFKNIQFKRYKVTATDKSNLSSLVNTYISVDSSEMSNFTVDSSQSVWRYTFDENTMDSSSSAVDATLLGDVNNVYKNNIQDYRLSKSLALNNIIFCGINNYGNVFKVDCNNNTFGNDCQSNTFGEYFQNNTFGNSNYRNTFGNVCQSNTFGNNCGSNTFGNSNSYNTFGNYFQNNTFGNGCNSNTFGNGCNSNTFGNECYYNTFGNGCGTNTFGNGNYRNTFGNDCYYNTFGNNCYYNTFGNSCSSNTFGNGCNNIRYQKDYTWYTIVENGNRYIDITSTQTTSSSSPLRNVTIAQGVNNTGTRKTISHNTVGDVFKTTYQPQNSQVISV